MNGWWIANIESIKRERRCSDVALAKRLDISPAMLAHVRMGRRALPLQARLRLLHALGYVVTRDLLLRALPSDVRSAVIDTKAGLIGGADTEGGLDLNAGLELPPHWK